MPEPAEHAWGFDETCAHAGATFAHDRVSIQEDWAAGAWTALVSCCNKLSQHGCMELGMMLTRSACVAGGAGHHEPFTRMPLHVKDVLLCTFVDTTRGNCCTVASYWRLKPRPKSRAHGQVPAWPSRPRHAGLLISNLQYVPSPLEACLMQCRPMPSDPELLVCGSAATFCCCLICISAAVCSHHCI